MDTTPIKQYILQQLQSGMSPTVIQSALMQTGWPEEVVKKAFTELQYQQIAATPASIIGAQDQSQSQNPAQQIEPNNIANSPEKYRVLTAVVDFFHAARTNLLTLIVSSLVGFGIAAGLSVLSSTAFGLSAFTALGIDILFDIKFTMGSATTSILSGILIIYVIQTISFAVIQVTASLPVYDGAAGRPSSIKNSLINSFSQLGRVFVATLYMYLAIFGPMIAFTILGFLTALAMLTVPMITPILPIAVFTGVIWALIAAFRYILAPYAVLFEPSLAVKHSLKRSQELLTNGGQWFVFKAALFFVTLAVILAMFIGLLAGDVDLYGPSTEQNNIDLVTSLIFDISLIIFSNGILVMLYRRQASSQTRPKISPTLEHNPTPIAQ